LVISSLTTALASMDSKRELTGKQLDLIRNYLLIKGVPADLRSRVLEYYQYLFTSSAALADLNMFSNMPPALNAQLNLSVNRRLVARCTFFRDVSNASLITLIAELQPLVFVPGQTIVVEGHVLRNIYFINKGMVQLWGGDSLVMTLHDNDNFGLEDYQNRAKQTGDADVDTVVSRTARALTYCDVMSLDVQRLLDVMAADEEFADRVRAHTVLESTAQKGKQQKKHMWMRGGGVRHAAGANPAGGSPAGGSPDSNGYDERGEKGGRLLALLGASKGRAANAGQGESGLQEPSSFKERSTTTLTPEDSDGGPLGQATQSFFSPGERTAPASSRLEA